MISFLYWPKYWDAHRLHEEEVVYEAVVCAVVVAEVVHTMLHDDYARCEFRESVVNIDCSSVSYGRKAVPFDFDIDHSRS